MEFFMSEENFDPRKIIIIATRVLTNTDLVKFWVKNFLMFTITFTFN